jgi:hypothetical protein
MMTLGLKTFRCRVRATGYTLTFDCLSPNALAAAYAVVQRVRAIDPVHWHQVVASEWNAMLGEYVVPANAIIVAADDAPPSGYDRVVFASPEPPQDVRRAS